MDEPTTRVGKKMGVGTFDIPAGQRVDTVQWSSANGGAHDGIYLKNDDELSWRKEKS